MGWNSSKIIPPLVSLGSSLSTDPYSKVNTEILAGIGEG